MFAPGTSASAVAAFGAAVRRFHPAGFRAMARASAEDLREVLPHVWIPALLLYGERDVRAPSAVAEHLRSALPDATLVTLPETGHVSPIEAPESFNAAVRRFLADHAAAAAAGER